ncbi:Hypothetical protein APO_1670 [Acetobacter pomorum DM001]|uniref:Uncharacterized protein n=2 Tax=Acetobacteraceae TaxID=433 RepID=F1YUP6_9PROT|nr:hypothetical protein [Acetobacter pomorum]EGE47453.1 Hypothetical protein APO_1670 [Acetobacter pomorum DM001]
MSTHTIVYKIFIWNMKIFTNITPKYFLVVAFICMFLSGCADDHGKGAMHTSVSRCFSKYPLAKGTAYKRFSCIYQAHSQYGPVAMGEHYNLLLQVDLASLSVGQEIDEGILTVKEGETALHWVTAKAYYQASQNILSINPSNIIILRK